MSINVNASAALERVRQWLVGYEPRHRTDKPKLDDLDLDFDLIDNRVIDSLGFMEFVFFLEDVVGHDLVQEARDPEAFRTLRAIDERILRAK